MLRYQACTHKKRGKEKDANETTWNLLARMTAEDARTPTRLLVDVQPNKSTHVPSCVAMMPVSEFESTSRNLALTVAPLSATNPCRPLFLICICEHFAIVDSPLKTMPHQPFCRMRVPFTSSPILHKSARAPFSTRIPSCSFELTTCRHSETM